MWGVALVALVGCGRIGFDDVEPIRQVLRLDRVDPGEQLDDFPLLVVLDDTRIDRMRLAPDASDLRFFDAGGVLIPHELEQLDPVLLVWVSVPRIEGLGTTLSFSYGAGPVAASQAPVWTSAYAGVWHLASDGRDSRGQLDAVAHGTSVAPGFIGSGLSFAAPNRDYLSVGDSSSFIPSSGFTISAWMKPTAIPTTFFAAISREAGNSGNDDLWLGINTDHAQVECNTAGVGSTVAAGSSQIVAGQWAHLAATISLTDERMYLNGLQVGARPVTTVLLFDPPDALLLGADRNGASQLGVADSDFLDGSLDEVRLETVARSAAWLLYDDAAMRDQVITY